METVIVVVLIAIIVIAGGLSAWYGMRNFRHYRDAVRESDEQWRRRDGGPQG